MDEDAGEDDHENEDEDGDEDADEEYYDDEAEADDDTQLYLFSTNANGLPDYKRSIGAFGGRYSRFIAWNQNSQGFFLFCRGCH